MSTVPATRTAPSAKGRSGMGEVRGSRGARNSFNGGERAGESPLSPVSTPPHRLAGPFNLTVRPALASDEVPLQFFFDAMLRNDYFLRRGQLREMLRGRYHQVWVAEIDTILVGVAVTTHGTRLVNVLVHPGYRGLGIGRALVGQSGADEVRVKLNGHNGDPRRFYEKLGFSAVEGGSAKEHIRIMRRTPQTGRA